MRILGIDPGLANTGWGVIDVIRGKTRPVSFGVINTTKEQSEPDRIHEIAIRIGEVAKHFSPDLVSMEDIFFTKNISSAIPVAKVIGGCIHELESMKLHVQLFSPPQIKTAVTGYGNAEKKQIQEMVKIHLGLGEIPRPDHAADALAIAICAYYHGSTNMRLNIR